LRRETQFTGSRGRLAGDLEFLLTHGRTVLLETHPVDPRDLLRGDYVSLSYKISNVPLKLFMPPLTNSPAAGSKVYVVLERRGDFHEIVRAETTAPSAEANQVVLRGRSGGRWWHPSADIVQVEYGLERYYVPEGTGNPRGKVTVEVAVPSSGNGMIKQVFIDGKPYREAMKQSR
jgi:uncharacterized membrane-anchored protein